MVTAVELCDIHDAVALLRPFDIDLPKIRLGTDGDGGYIFADSLCAEQPVLSFGVSTNCDLEFALAERGHSIVMFDPSVDGVPKEHPNFTFHKIGVAARDSADGRFLSLENALRLAGLYGRSDVVLKIDVEGFEYEALARLRPQILDHFEQIALEVHWLDRLVDPNFRREYIKTISAINDKFVPFHVHANNCCAIAIVGGEPWDLNQGPHTHRAGGTIVPVVLEMSYIRKKSVRALPSSTVYPTILDYPNSPLHPDHMLDFFPFLPCSDEHFELLRQTVRVNAWRFQAHRR